MTTSTFFFAVNLSQTNQFISAPQQTKTSPFYSSNQALINTCPTGMFAYLQDPSIKGSSQAGCTLGNGVGGCCTQPNGKSYCGNAACCTSSCSGSQSNCAGFDQCNPHCTNPAKPTNTFIVNYNCYIPNPTFFIPYQNAIPNPVYQSLNFISLYPTIDNPQVAVYSITYNNSNISTLSQVQSLINSFGSGNVNVQLASSSSGTNYNDQNDQVLQRLIQSMCSTNPSNLFTSPCSSFCSSTPNTVVQNTSISSGNPPTNCQPSWTTYCNSPETFNSKDCLGWYSSQMVTSGNTQVLPASSPAFQILTTNCANPNYYTPPPSTNPYGAYTINPSSPPVCGCFYPPHVSESWYANLAYTYPGLSLSDTLIQCNYPPCSNTISVNYYNTNPNCPVENTTVVNCINSATIINSNTGNIQQTNDCSAFQDVTSSTTDSGSIPINATSSVLTSSPSVLISSSPSVLSSSPSVLSSSPSQQSSEKGLRLSIQSIILIIVLIIIAILTLYGLYRYLRK